MSQHDRAAHKLPWVRVHEQLGSPDYDALAMVERHSEREQSLKHNVAICLSGQVRTLVQPAVWGAVSAFLTDMGNRPLYMVLTTSSEVSDLHHADLGASEACGLEAALNGLRPRKLRFIFNRPSIPCGNSEAAQFSKWSDCVDLVSADEEASGGAARYDYIFRARPDLLWTTKVAFDELISRVDRLPGVPIVTSNDWAMLLPRQWWGAVASFREMECAERCGPKAPATLREPFGIRNNSYCLMISHLAAHNAPHIEASHPDGALTRHYRTTASWASALRTPSLQIHRAALQASGARAGLATLCRPNAINDTAMAWRCTYCRSTSTDGTLPDLTTGEAAAQKGLRACPTAPWDAEPSVARGGRAKHGSNSGRHEIPDDANCTAGDHGRAFWAELASNLKHAQAGHCGGTDGNTPCESASKRMARGSWDADKSGVGSIAECAELCRSCEACVFVSFSRANNDCSWYAHCAMRDLVQDPSYQSLRVRGHNMLPGPM